MPSAYLPNDVMSNLCMLIVLPFATFVSLRIKAKLCDTVRRMPLQYKVDQYLIMGNNILAFSYMVIWASYMKGNSTARLELLVALDLLIGMHVQRYLLATVHADDTTPYHEPGPLALSRRARRAKLSMVVTMLVWEIIMVLLMHKPYLIMKSQQMRLR